MRRVALGTFTLSLVLSACYGASEEDDDGGGAGSSSGGSSSGGSSAGAGHGGSSAGTSSGGSVTGGSTSGGSGGSTTFGCPSTPPTSGDACTPPPGEEPGVARSHCSWGDDPRPQCRTTALCTADFWQVTEPDAGCESGPLPPGCPVEPPNAGEACSDTALGCWYDGGTRCWCSDCEGGSGYPICQTIDPPEWACAQPATGCPTAPPQAGSACKQEGLECGLDCEQQITCQDGRWQWTVGECPICAAPDTPIDTPEGPRSIASLAVGDLVYSVHEGAIVAVPILLTGSTPVTNHRVVRVVASDGTVLEMSPGHPTADGRTFADLLHGGALDERHAIVDSSLVPFTHARTHDILPASSSGTYFAAGVLVGSTLQR